MKKQKKKKKRKRKIERRTTKANGKWKKKLDEKEGEWYFKLVFGLCIYLLDKFFLGMFVFAFPPAESFPIFIRFFLNVKSERQT